MMQVTFPMRIDVHRLFSFSQRVSVLTSVRFQFHFHPRRTLLAVTRPKCEENCYESVRATNAAAWIASGRGRLFWNDPIVFSPIRKSFRREIRPRVKKEVTMPSTGEKPMLRLVTYMCPSHPVEMFETIMAYLEEEIKVEAVLQYESRNPGPLPDRKDPFEHNLVDLAFMTPTEYLRLQDIKNEHCELLPVAAVFKHPKNSTESAEYYSDIIVHSDTRSYVNALEDLRGCQWAYNHEHSLSGYISVLKALQEIGEGSSFFGNTLRAGSHLGCIQMVQQKQAEAAAVDANVLAYNQKKMPDYGKDISVLSSLGPLPPYPIVINKKVPESLKNGIVEALLKATKTRLWGKRLASFGIVGFQENHPDKYVSIRETCSVLKNKRLNNIYY